MSSCANCDPHAGRRHGGGWGDTAFRGRWRICWASAAPCWPSTDSGGCRRPWAAQDSLREPLAGSAAALALLLEVVFWTVPVLALLLPSVIIIEECWLFTALWQWWQLLRRHLTRVLLYELLALLPAVVATQV